jgi:hypothetical protein
MQANGFDVDYAILILQSAFSKDELTPRDHHPVSLIQVRRNNHIGDAGLATSYLDRSQRSRRQLPSYGWEYIRPHLTLLLMCEIKAPAVH